MIEQPDGIIITVGAKMYGDHGYRNWLRNFLSAMYFDFNNDIDKMLEQYKASGNLVFQGPSTRIQNGEYKTAFNRNVLEKRFVELHRSQVSEICLKLGLTLAADYQLVEEALDRLKDEQPGVNLFPSEIRKLQNQLWESRVCEYICVEKAKIINPDWVSNIQDRFKQEQEYIIAQMVAYKLTHTKEPEGDFEKSIEDFIKDSMSQRSDFAIAMGFTLLAQKEANKTNKSGRG